MSDGIPKEAKEVIEKMKENAKQISQKKIASIEAGK